jgi:hypothetical protein
MAMDIMTPNPLRDKILARARQGTIAQFKVKGDLVYQEEMKTFKKAYVILDMFKDFGIGCGMPEGMTVDPIIIPLPHMTPEAMEALIRWCYHHQDDVDMTVEQLNDNLYHCTGDIKDSWDIELYNSLDEDALFDLLVSAKYLGIPEMRDSLTTYIANCIVQAAEDKEKHGEGGEEEEETEDTEHEEGETSSGVDDQQELITQKSAETENEEKREVGSVASPQGDTKAVESSSPKPAK